MRLSGLTIAWRGRPSLDDWVAYCDIQSKQLIWPIARLSGR